MTPMAEAMTVQEAIAWLAGRAALRCDQGQNVIWNLRDVTAVNVLASSDLVRTLPGGATPRADHPARP